MKPEEIRKYRNALGLSQEQLADLFGVTPTTVSRWERGEVPPSAPGMMLLAFRALELERGIDPTGELARLSRRVLAKINARA